MILDLSRKRGGKMELFKDKCDECGIFDYLKGVNGKCLCKKCYYKAKEKRIQLSFFNSATEINGTINRKKEVVLEC